jgi:hypothetical protein
MHCNPDCSLIILGVLSKVNDNMSALGGAVVNFYNVSQPLVGQAVIQATEM